MNRDIADKASRFQIATSVLEDIVRGSLLEGGFLQRESGASLLRIGEIDVEVSELGCSVSIEAEALYGEALLALAENIQLEVSERLEGMTGMRVESVDVSFTGVYPSADAE